MPDLVPVNSYLVWLSVRRYFASGPWASRLGCLFLLLPFIQLVPAVVNTRISWHKKDIPLKIPFNIRTIFQSIYRNFLRSGGTEPFAEQWTNVDLSSKASCGIHMRAISWDVLMNLIRNKNLWLHFSNYFHVFWGSMSSLVQNQIW